jgi:hypothetical protein
MSERYGFTPEMICGMGLPQIEGYTFSRENRFGSPMIGM